MKKWHILRHLQQILAQLVRNFKIHKLLITLYEMNQMQDEQSCNKAVSWYLGYRTFLKENPDIFKKFPKLTTFFFEMR